MMLLLSGWGWFFPEWTVFFFFFFFVSLQNNGASFSSQLLVFFFLRTSYVYFLFLLRLVFFFFFCLFLLPLLLVLVLVPWNVRLIRCIYIYCFSFPLCSSWNFLLCDRRPKSWRCAKVQIPKLTKTPLWLVQYQLPMMVARTYIHRTLKYTSWLSPINQHTFAPLLKYCCDIIMLPGTSC